MDGLGNTINYTYDSTGNRQKEEIKDPQGQLQKVQQFQYDILSRRNRVLLPNSGYVESNYDALGNLSMAYESRDLIPNEAFHSPVRLARWNNVTKKWEIEGFDLFGLEDSSWPVVQLT